MDNLNTIETFYCSFKNRDFQTMASFYHPNAVFSDPIFPKLNSKQAQAMWHMLCSRGKETIVTYSDVIADASTGSCSWVAVYKFGAQ